MIGKYQSDELFTKRVAAAIWRHGLREPVLLALQAGHPLTFLSSQLLWVLQPALSLFLPSEDVRQLADLLEHPEGVQALQAYLQQAGNEVP